MLRSTPPLVWCAANPGSTGYGRCWVPALRSSTEEVLHRVRDTRPLRAPQTFLYFPTVYGPPFSSARA